MIYKRKIIDEILKYINTDDVIVLHWARQVGKTSIMLYIQDILQKERKINYFIDLEDYRNLTVLNNSIDEFINYLKAKWVYNKNKVYIFIDEIQYLTNPSGFLKLIADHYKNIKLIVSWSSSFEIKSKFKNSLVWRTINFEIYPLDFEEFLLFKWYKIDLSESINFSSIINEDLKNYYKEYIINGWYPKIVLTDDLNLKEKYLIQIIDTYIKKDIRDIGKIQDIEKFNKLLEVLSSQSWNLLNISEISNTVNLHKKTVENYLFILENTYIIRLIRPYSKNIRSELFKTPKIYFYDTWLLQILYFKQLSKEIIWNIFETSIFSEFVKSFGKENIFYWRTQDKKEIDFILNLKNNIIPIEVKTNFQKFSNTSISYFLDKYKLKKYYIVWFYWEIKWKDCIYPWNLRENIKY